MPLNATQITYERMRTSAELWAREKELLALVHAPTSISVPDYDAAFNALVEQLRLVESVSDGGLEEADFAVSRYVGPSSEITVVARPALAEKLVETAVNALNRIGRPFAITFDTGSYVCVVSSGHALGYSDWEELEQYGFPPW